VDLYQRTFRLDHDDGFDAEFGGYFNRRADQMTSVLLRRAISHMNATSHMTKTMT